MGNTRFLGENIGKEGEFEESNGVGELLIKINGIWGNILCFTDSTLAAFWIKKQWRPWKKNHKNQGNLLTNNAKKTTKVM